MLWLKHSTLACLIGEKINMGLLFMDNHTCISYLPVQNPVTPSTCFRIVEKLNSSIGQDPNSKSLIGVLDIYGFESFKQNR